MIKLTFVKIGGSLITDKNKPYTVRPDYVKSVCMEIKKVLLDCSDTHLVLANGVGSFAHTSAKKYDTMNGFHDENGRFGCAKVMYDALNINRILIEQLLEEGIPAVHLQPSGIFLAENGQHKDEYIATLTAMIDQGLIPVLYGDVIIDTKKGSTIYSADKTMPLLIRKLNNSGKYNVNSFVNIGHYDGVLDNKNHLIQQINSKNIEEVRTYFFDNKQIDVTGGMRTKVEELFSLAKSGVNSIIVNGTILGRACSAILGQDVKGTKITN